MAEFRPNAEGSARQVNIAGDNSGTVNLATAQQVGDGNTQIVYSYSARTWTDGVAPPPLVDTSGSITSPYRGLAAFEERDAALFFGRESVATEVLGRISDQLDKPGPMVVSGVSGAGKSSLLRAGVLPRLRGVGLRSMPGSQSWSCVVFTPGHAPLDELAVRVASVAGVDAASVRKGLDSDPSLFALTASQAAGTASVQTSDPAEPEPTVPVEPARLVLVVDQFEQLFTRCQDEIQRRAFIAALHAAATPSHRSDSAAAVVVLVLRSDIEGRCADYPELTEAVKNRYLLTSMTRRQLRLAITEPAKKAGSRVEAELVDLLLDDMEGGGSTIVGGEVEPLSGAGVLPLLSHALDRAWRSRVGDSLTVSDYERAGGIARAVADSAQHIYDRLTPAQQVSARQLFIRLVATAVDGTDAADRAGRTELVHGKNDAEARDMAAVVEAFAAERLLTVAADTVEISHEALLTAWPLLCDTWLAETHADRIVRTRLRAAADEWAGNGHDPSYLYSGSVLAAATETCARVTAEPDRHPPLGRDERAFLDASNRAQQRRLLVRRGIGALVVSLTVVLGVVATVAYTAARSAAHQRDIAISRLLVNESVSLGDTDPTASRLKALAAWRIHDSPETRYAVLHAGSRPGILDGHSSGVRSLAFTRDGKTLATAGEKGAALWDVAGHERKADLPVDILGASVTVSPDGRTAVVTGEHAGTALWDIPGRRRIGAPLTDIETQRLAFSADGSTLVTGRGDTVRLWNVRERREIGPTIVGVSDSHSQLALNADGSTLVISRDDTVRLWDVPGHHQIGNPIVVGQDPSDPVRAVSLTPDGGTLATGTATGAVQLWNVADQHAFADLAPGEPGYYGRLGGPSVTAMAFSPDGTTLATAGRVGNAIRLWSVPERRALGSALAGHDGAVHAVAFSPDGKTLASASADSTVRLWDVRGRNRYTRLAAIDGGGVPSIAFSPDGRILAGARASAATVRLWDVAGRHQIGEPLDNTAPVTSVAFSPDGEMLATGARDGTVRLWDVPGRHRIGDPFTVPGDIGAVSSIVFSPDGETLATSAEDGTVRLWDVPGHRQAGDPLTVASPVPVYSMAFSPDGETLATGGGELFGRGVVRLWDVSRQEELGGPLWFGQPNSAAGIVLSMTFDSEGGTLIAGSRDGKIRRWDVPGHRQVGKSLSDDSTASGFVRSAAFTHDGTVLATSAGGGTVHLWEAFGHRPIGEALIGRYGSGMSLAFTPDGKTLAVAGDGGSVDLWDVGPVIDVATVAARLCTESSDVFGPEEWARSIPETAPYREICP